MLKFKLFKGVVLCSSLASLFLMSRCSKENMLNETDSVSNLTSAVYNLGYDTTGIKINGDTVRVEGDIILYKSNLNKTTPRQASMFSGSYLATSPIKYYIPVGITDEASILAAITEIESIQNLKTGSPLLHPPYMNLGFTRVYSTSDADLIFNMYYNPSSAICGEAEAPTVVPNLPIVMIPQLKIGKNVRLNTHHWNNLSSSARKFLIAHELGHSFGLRHTNWRNGEPEYGNINSVSVGAYGIPGTNNSSKNPDANSVFNMNTCGKNWSGFTNGDKIALWHVAGNGG
ncbi:M57 family metalloprotease [Sphingobacterium faecium]|uniref:M57 family metalloprotease n=1 Tax=Sphingobacterium faecium TaxID=34087 RepID=UPI003209E472